MIPCRIMKKLGIFVIIVWRVMRNYKSLDKKT